MKVSSLPNLNRETTSFPNFFTLFQHPADHHDDDTALQIDERSCDTEASETSPYKDILSPFDEMNEIRLFAGTSSVGLIRRESVQTQHSTCSVGSNQFSCGGSSATSGSVGPNPAHQERSFEMSFVQKQSALQQLRRKDHPLRRPHRGLPKRSVSVLRTWMFQNFLHPYPKDAEKFLLAMKSGLTKCQINNWFTNARVRLWKPMINEIYAEMIEEKKWENDR